MISCSCERDAFTCTGLPDSLQLKDLQRRNCKMPSAHDKIRPLRSWSYSIKVLVSCGALWLLAGILTSKASRRAFSEDMNQRDALPDIFHPGPGNTPRCDQAGGGDACPEWLRPFANQLPDKLILLTFVLLASLVGGAGWRNGRNLTVSMALVSEFMALNAIILIFRTTTILATTLPAPSPLCRNATWATRPSQGWFLTTVDCNDAMFSGHTIVNSLAAVMWHCSYMSPLTKLCYWMYFLFCCFASTVTADHYTSDVLVSAYITIAVALHRRKSFTILMGPGATTGEAWFTRVIDKWLVQQKATSHIQSSGNHRAQD